MQYPHHFELEFQVLILKINGLLCIVQLLLWHDVNKGILIDWSTICKKKYKFKQQAKTHGCDENDLF